MRLRTILLTGATSGIGAAAAAILVEDPCVLVLHGPSPLHQVQGQLDRLRDRAAPATELHYVAADFADPDAVHALAGRVCELAPGLDVVVNNAATAGLPGRRTGAWATEQTFAINYLAPTLLTDLLLDRVESTGGRVVNVSSATHLSATLALDDLTFAARPYTPVQAYAQSKLAVVVHSRRLAGRTDATVLSLHPGVVATGLLHAMFDVRGEPVARGGRAVVAALESEAASGSYLDGAEAARANPAASSTAVQRALHETTCRLLGRRIR